MSGAVLLILAGLFILLQGVKGPLAKVVGF